MRPCKKNLRTMYYALYSNEVPIYDEKGNTTFETTKGYLPPEEFKGNLSAGASMVDEQPFGADVSYDRIIQVYGDCPINVHSLIWVENDKNGDADYEVSGEPMTVKTDGRRWQTVRIPIKKRHGNNS